MDEKIIIEKLKKLKALYERTPYKAEAKTAKKIYDKLMANYDINLLEVDEKDWLKEKGIEVFDTEDGVEVKINTGWEDNDALGLGIYQVLKRSWAKRHSSNKGLSDGLELLEGDK
jgi:hypothetical protein